MLLKAVDCSWLLMRWLGGEGWLIALAIVVSSRASFAFFSFAFPYSTQTLLFFSLFFSLALPVWYVCVEYVSLTMCVSECLRMRTGVSLCVRSEKKSHRKGESLLPVSSALRLLLLIVR